MTITPDDIRAASEEYKHRVEQHCTDIVQRLSLQPPESPVHNVEAYRDGLRVPIVLSQNLTVYVYCLPWARGWSIFTEKLDADIYSFSWRFVPEPWRAYQQPVYAPRDVSGPWNCPPEQIAAAFEYTVRRLTDRGKRRRAALRQRGWTY